jgi:hypothetical protein
LKRPTIGESRLEARTWEEKEELMWIAVWKMTQKTYKMQRTYCQELNYIFSITSLKEQNPQYITEYVINKFNNASDRKAASVV